MLTFPLKLVRSQENVSRHHIRRDMEAILIVERVQRGDEVRDQRRRERDLQLHRQRGLGHRAQSTTRGSAKVYLDGVYLKTISLYSSSAQSRRVVFAQAWATSGSTRSSWPSSARVVTRASTSTRSSSRSSEGAPV